MSQDFDFVTDRLAVGNVASRVVPGFVAVVSLLHTERPGLICDELRGAPAVPMGVAVDELGGVPVLHIDIGDGESKAFGRDMHDMEDWLGSATAFIARHIEAGCVLVHCGAGKSRSVAVVVAYLCRYAGMSYAEALALVKARRPGAAPCDAFAAAVKRWLRLDEMATKGPRR